METGSNKITHDRNCVTLKTKDEREPVSGMDCIRLLSRVANVCMKDEEVQAYQVEQSFTFVVRRTYRREVGGKAKENHIE